MALGAFRAAPMIVTGLLTTLAAWGVLWAIGEAPAHLLFGRRSRTVASGARLRLGLAMATCLLEAAGYALPIRLAAWLLLIPAAYGAREIALAWRLGGLRERGVASASLSALAIGLVPVGVAGRFTAAALTNNDGTYYITAADRLQRLPWMITYQPIPTDQCLAERVLHTWNWRTGTPNLMAAVSTFSGLPSQASLAVVTAILLACVPPAVIGVARGMGMARGGAREVVVALIAACSAAPAFLGFQHMTGHLAVCSLFPLCVAAALAAVRLGGLRRHAHAGLLFGSAVALFADGAPTLVVIA